MKQLKEKTTSYRKYRKDLTSGPFKSFFRYLLPAAVRETMGSLNAGLGAANIATSLAALTGTAIVGVAGVAAAGAVTVSVVCSVVGAIALAIGVIGLKKEYDKNKKDIEEIVGDKVQDGKIDKLKKNITSLTYHLGLVATKSTGIMTADGKLALNNMLFSLHAIKGKNIREKLCDIYDVDETLPEEEALEQLFNKMSAKHPMLNASRGMIAEGFKQLEIEYQESMRDYTAEVSSIVRTLPNSTPAIEDRANLQRFIEKLNQLPGDNFYEKMACLTASESSDTLQQLLATATDGTTNLDLLYNALQKEVETQYFELIKLTKEKSAGKYTEDITTKLNAFKQTLSLLEGIDSKTKLDTLFNNKFWERPTPKFAMQARAHPAIGDITDADMEKLVEAKKYIDKELYSDSFMTPLDYAKHYFTAFAGGLTGFGIVAGVGAIVGVSVATGGVGLGVLIGACVLAAVGFSLGLWYSNYTKKRELNIKKEIAAAHDSIDNACEHAQEFLNEAEYGPRLGQEVETDSLLDLAGPEVELKGAPLIQSLAAAPAPSKVKQTEPADRLREQNLSLQRENALLREQLNLYTSYPPEPSERGNAPAPTQAKGAKTELKKPPYEPHRFHRPLRKIDHQRHHHRSERPKSSPPKLSDTDTENTQTPIPKINSGDKK